MSLNRFSYLESWEQHPPPFLRQGTGGIPEDAPDSTSDGRLSPGPPEPFTQPFLSSSVPSRSIPRTIRHKLSFNPVSGPGWGEPSSTFDTEEERRSPIPWNQQYVGSPEAAPEPAVEEEEIVYAPPDIVFKDPQWGVAETTGAYEVSKIKRIAQVSTAVVYCLFAAGPVFGFAAIKPVLIEEGVYSEYCRQDELETGELCYGQETRLNLMFTIAAVATNVFALPVGTILDAYGPRVSGVIGSICIAIGSFLFGNAGYFPFDAYIFGYLFLALGGPFVFISSFQLSNTFPKHSGLILSLLTGAFDASSALFLIFRLLHQRTNGSFSIHRFFTIYLVVPALIFVVQLSYMPGTSYKTAGELVQQVHTELIAESQDTADQTIADIAERDRQRQDRREQRQNVVHNIQDLLDDGTVGQKIIDLNFDRQTPDDAPRQQDATIKKQVDAPSSDLRQKQKHATGGVWGAMHGASALRQIRSPWFILIMLFTVIQMLRINYFVATIRSQYEYLLGSYKLSRRMNEVFDVLLPVGGIFSIPFIGSVLDNASTTMVIFILVLVATIIGILGCIPHSLGAGYANIVLFVLYRPFYYTAVSDYTAKVFGFQTFGKVYGLIICLAGASNFLQTGLDALTFRAFEQNPIPVNILLTLAGFLVGLSLTTFVFSEARMRRGNLADEVIVEEGVGMRINGTHDGNEATPLVQAGDDPDSRREPRRSYGTTNRS